jgi:sortase A
MIGLPVDEQIDQVYEIARPGHGGSVMSWRRRVSHLLLVFGVLLLGIYAGARLHSVLLSRAAVRNFKQQQQVTLIRDVTGGEIASKAPDFALWSPKRISDYQQSLSLSFSPAVALLRVPKIDLEVPVLEGTDDLTLNRGVGLIAGTARPGETGNIGIAGHRDGFFRGLKDVQVGDTFELATRGATKTYIIDRIVIVDPNDVSVLSARSTDSVTLVTCYPFYFVGSAPQRYIVQASIVDSGSRSAN